jgi:hypothetical protein
MGAGDIEPREERGRVFDMTSATDRSHRDFGAAPHRCPRCSVGKAADVGAWRARHCYENDAARCQHSHRNTLYSTLSGQAPHVLLIRTYFEFTLVRVTGLC